MAGGVWQIPLYEAVANFNLAASPTTTQFEAVPAPTALAPKGVSTPSNLLAQDRPTLLTKWLITNVYVPVLGVFAAPAAAAIDFSLYARLYKNGLIAWQGTPADPLSVAAAAAAASALIVSDLVNPIEINRGDNLRLAVGYIGPSHNDSGENSINVFSAGQQVAGRDPLGGHAGAGSGVITYEAIELPGRRRL